MRVHIGPPPHSPYFDPRLEGWNQLHEPTPVMLQFIAAPIAVGLAVILYLGWSRMTPVAGPKYNFAEGKQTTGSPTETGPVATFVGVIGGFFLLILVHELLHAVTMPDWGTSSQTLIGVWPSRVLFYAAHLGPLSKSRFIVVFLMPLIVLTIIPLMISVLLQVGNTFVAAISIVNGACACGDLVGAGLIAWQVPRSAVVRNQGWQTWWKQA